jgi:hypothetical protein
MAALPSLNAPAPDFSVMTILDRSTSLASSHHRPPSAPSCPDAGSRVLRRPHHGGDVHHARSEHVPA